jgi:uncharacterized protein (TIGR02001 family)
MSMIPRRWRTVLACAGVSALSSPALAAPTTPGAEPGTPSAAGEQVAEPILAVTPVASVDEDPAKEIAASPLVGDPVSLSGDLTIARALKPLDAATANRLDGPAGLTFSANAAVVSEYRFRGINLSGGGPALQGGVDVTHTSGFFAGTWASTLDNATVGYGDVELDLYGGWSGEIAEGLTATVGVIAYVFPDAPASGFNYYEVYGSLGFILGPVSTTVGVAYDPQQNGLNFGGLQRDNLYLYTNVSTPIPTTPLTVTAHLGYTDGAFAFTRQSTSWDWSFEVSLPVWGPLSASLAYVDAAADITTGTFNPTSSTVVAKLSARF